MRKVGTFFNQMTDKKAEVFTDSGYFLNKYYLRGKQVFAYPITTETRKEADNAAQHFVNSKD